MTPYVLATIIGVAASVFAGISVHLYNRRSDRRADRDDARDEALRLAQIRGETIEELSGRIDALSSQLGEAEKHIAELESAMSVFIEQAARERERLKAQIDAAIRDAKTDRGKLEQAVEELGEQSAEHEQLARGVGSLLAAISSDLSQSPPDITNALERIRRWSQPH